MNARHLQRRWQEQQWAKRGDDNRAVHIGYAVELYGSPRFAHLDAAYRHAMCMQVLCAPLSIRGEPCAWRGPRASKRGGRGQQQRTAMLVCRSPRTHSNAGLPQPSSLELGSIVNAVQRAVVRLPTSAAWRTRGIQTCLTLRSLEERECNLGKSGNDKAPDQGYKVGERTRWRD